MWQCYIHKEQKWLLCGRMKNLSYNNGVWPDSKPPAQEQTHNMTCGVNTARGGGVLRRKCLDSSRVIMKEPGLVATAHSAP